jgi:hypothetical protein
MAPVIDPRTTRFLAGVRPGLGPPHAHTGPERHPKADDERGVRARRDRCGEDRRERGDRSVDQADQAGLHDAQKKVAFVAVAGALDRARDDRGIAACCGVGLRVHGRADSVGEKSA